MAEERYLNESGLLRFWNTKIKPLIYKKATLQQDLVVKNPRVTVDLPDNYTFPAGSTMEDLFRYLYRHVYDEVQPSSTVILPSVTVKVTLDSTAEVEDDITYTVQKDSFSAGQIGTCEAPWEEAAHQTRIASGSTEISNSFKIYSGSTNVPDQCTTEPEMSGGKVTGTLHIANSGTNNIGIYFCGTSSYTASTASSRTSYNKPANVTGVSSFGGGTTDKSQCKTGYSVGYYPSFGNVEFSEITTSPTLIKNLGNRMNSATTAEFYYGPTDTTGSNNTTFEIYFPATLNGSVQYKDPITGAWTNVPTTVTSGHYATMPAKEDKSRYPNNSELQSGKEYKLISQASGLTYGSRHYRLILTNA